MTELTKKDIAFAEGCAFRVCNYMGAFCGDEIREGARVGLAKAFLKFDEKKSTNFKLFAYYQIKFAIVDHIRQKCGRRGQKIMPADLFKVFSDYDIELSCDGLEEKIIVKDLIYKFTKHLENESELMASRFDKIVNKDMISAEIARSEGVTDMAISHMMKEIRFKFRKFLADNEL